MLGKYAEADNAGGNMPISQKEAIPRLGSVKIGDNHAPLLNVP